MEDQKLKLHEAEYRFACIVWEHEPLSSGELAALCLQQLNWKRTTTYTVLKKLCVRGILKNENTIVTSLVGREQVRQYESRKVLENIFDNSLPVFLTAFMADRKISEEEARELKALIDQYKEGEPDECDNADID